MANGYNQNWGTEHMIDFVDNVVDSTVQYCQWTHNGAVCNTLIQRQDTSAHLRNYHGINSQQYYHQCRWWGCTASPMTIGGLKTHVKESHFPALWACPKCTQTFKRRDNFLGHMSEH